MRAQLRSGVAAAERAFSAAGPSAENAPEEPLITISTEDMVTGDPCCQVTLQLPTGIFVSGAVRRLLSHQTRLPFRTNARCTFDTLRLSISHFRDILEGGVTPAVAADLFATRWNTGCWVACSQQRTKRCAEYIGACGGTGGRGRVGTGVPRKGAVAQGHVHHPHCLLAASGVYCATAAWHSSHA